MKEYLKDINALRHRIVNGGHELRALQKMAEQLEDVDGAAEQIRLRQDKIIAELRQFRIVVADAETKISQLDTRYSDILYRRYICDMTWQQIADDTHYTLRYVFQLHGQALIEFGKISNIS